jgi:hypothetical protein
MAEQRTLNAERAELPLADQFAALSQDAETKRQAEQNPNLERIYLGMRDAFDIAEKVARRAPPALDAEGQPALPLPAARMYVQNGYRRASVLPGKGKPLYTAEQVRQAQRDAVAVERERNMAQIQHLTHERDRARSDIRTHLDEITRLRAQLARTSAPEGAPAGMEASQYEIVAEYRKNGWSFEYEPGTRYVGLNHPQGGKQSVCEIRSFNVDKFGHAIAGLLNSASLYAPTSASPQPLSANLSETSLQPLCSAGDPKSQPADQNKTEKNDE